MTIRPSLETLELKVGKKSYTIHAVTDYFLDNGACVMFFPKDNSVLPFREYRRDTNANVSKKEWKRLKPLLTEYNSSYPGCKIFRFIPKGTVKP